MIRYFVLKNEVEGEKIFHIFELLAIKQSDKSGEYNSYGIDLASGEVWTQPIYSSVFVTKYNFAELDEITDVDSWAWHWFDDEKVKRKGDEK